MDKLDLIRVYNNLQAGNALVVLTDKGPIELINSTNKTSAEDVAIIRETITLLLEENIVDAVELSIGTKYIHHGDTIIPVTKVYEVDSDEYLAEDKVKNMSAPETFEELLARKYVAKYEDIMDLKVHWNDSLNTFVIKDLDDNNISYKSFKDMHSALYRLL